MLMLLSRSWEPVLVYLAVRVLFVRWPFSFEMAAVWEEDLVMQMSCLKGRFDVLSLGAI